MEYRISTLRQLNRSVSFNNRDFLHIGPTPHDEKCTQAGYNIAEGILECNIYADLLQRVYGPAPESCEYVIIENHHDEAGIYHEVGIIYEVPDDSMDYDEMNDDQKARYECAAASEAYAMKVESGCEKWDEEALQALREAEHSLYLAKVIKMKVA
jgi:hypothetical protein